MTLLRALLLSCLLLTVPTAFAHEPFRNGATASPADEDELRLWDESRAFSKEIERAQWLSADKETNRYLQGVMDKLFPEFHGVMRVQLLRLPEVNAFATPNGDIYIHQGLLARFDNEAQLAAVLAHEGTHFVNRHGVQMRSSDRTLAGANVLLQTALDFTPLKVSTTMGSAATAMASRFGQKVMVNGLLVTSAFGYSRSMEQEADDDGFARLKSAGYDVTEAYKIFGILAREMEARKVSEPFFFSTHPQLKSRAENFKELAQGASGGVRGEEGFSRQMAALRMDNLRNELNGGRFSSIIAHLSQPDSLAHYPVEALYFLGEAYRLRAEEDDLKKAEEAYRAMLKALPDHFATNRALGMLKLKQGAPAEAEVFLTKCMALAPNADEQEFVSQYLELACRRQQKGA